MSIFSRATVMVLTLYFFLSFSPTVNAQSCFEVYEGDNSTVSTWYNNRSYTNTSNFYNAQGLDTIYSGRKCDARGTATSSELQALDPIIASYTQNSKTDVTINRGSNEMALSHVKGTDYEQALNIVYVPIVSIPNEATFEIKLSENAGWSLPSSWSSISLMVLNEDGASEMFSSVGSIIDFNMVDNKVVRMLIQIDTQYNGGSSIIRGESIPAGTRLFLSADSSKYVPLSVIFELESKNSVDIHFSRVVNTAGLVLLALEASETLIQLYNDSDGDGMHDEYEIQHGLDPNNADDAALDNDNDGLTNLAEFNANSNPTVSDTDGDGVLDGDDSHPTNDKRWTTRDSDGDSVTDDIENQMGFDPHSPLDVWQDNDQDGAPLFFEQLTGKDESLKDNDVFSSNADLIRLAMVDTQHRIIEDATLNDLVTSYDNGKGIDSIYAELLDERNFAQMGFIGRVYQAAMMRKADANGASFYRKRLNTGMSELEMVTGFVESNEFQRRYGELNNGEFIALVYNNVMARKPDDGGYQYWLGQLDAGTVTRAQLLLGFINSNEYIRTRDAIERVRILALIITRTQYADDMLAEFVSQIDQEQSSQMVIAQLLASDGFRSRVMDGLSLASADTDGDGVLDGIEFLSRTDAQVKDNDVSSSGSDIAFVKQVYRDLIGEQWSQAQLSSDLKFIKRTVNTREKWVASVMARDHYVEHFQAAARLITITFSRSPDWNGANFWQQKYNEGMKLSQIANVFSQSNEFNVRYGALSDREFIEFVYRNGLSRGPDNQGVQFWLNKLVEGTTRGELLSLMSQSAEAKTKAMSKVNTFLAYAKFLKRESTTGESYYGSRKDLSDLVFDLINSNEYINRFN